MASTQLSGHNEPILWPALKVATAAGVGGAIFGGTAGILQSPTPVLFATFASLQWALLGGTYWGMRGAILNTRPLEERTPENKRYISSLAGGLSFAVVGAITRGRKNVIPGTIMGSLGGYLGQIGYNNLDARHTAAIITPPEPKEPLWKRALNSKYSPMKVLSDEQYAAILKEKLLRVDTDIALIDDDIEKWKKVQEEAQKTQSISIRTKPAGS